MAAPTEQMSAISLNKPKGSGKFVIVRVVLIWVFLLAISIYIY